MKIALFGYGKMGKMIEQLALAQGHLISAKVDIDSEEIDFSEIDVAIDFSTPEAAYSNIIKCLKNGVPVISGTTGWLDQYELVVDACEQYQGAFIYASNFSLGVNIFFQLNTYLAKMMAGLKDYSVILEEIHHTQKVDAPSGTAITLAEDIIKHTAYEKWGTNEEEKNSIPIRSKRIDEIAGIHSVNYTSETDQIAIKHSANNRKGFALGALVAAEWLLGKQGVFSMNEVLNLS